MVIFQQVIHTVYQLPIISYFYVGLIRLCCDKKTVYPGDQKVSPALPVVDVVDPGQRLPAGYGEGQI